MNLNLKNLFVFLGIGTSLACGRESQSQLDAENSYNFKKTTYWFEKFGVYGNDDDVDQHRDFYQYVRENHKALLATDDPLVPETLKGLWFLDGAGVPDQTFSIRSASSIGKIGVNEDGQDVHNLTWKVGGPFAFAWGNTGASHSAIPKVIEWNLEYELIWKDCPDDVVEERLILNEIIEDQNFNPECKAVDQEFAVVHPFITIHGMRLPIPEEVIYFDLYLKPRGQSDAYVWERRSKKIGSKKFHRYQFTQIVGKNGERLSTYDKDFVPHMKKLADENDLREHATIIYTMSCDPETTDCSKLQVPSLDNTDEFIETQCTKDIPYCRPEEIPACRNGVNMECMEQAFKLAPLEA